AALSWGDYAILYRKHRVGEHIEGRLLRAGIPCRLARGRSLIEDEVIGYVIAALRVVRTPDDPAAMHTFAKCVLSDHFLQEVEAALGENSDFLVSARALAERRAAWDPDTPHPWRPTLLHQNVRALARSHAALLAVIVQVVAHPDAPYRNHLEHRPGELMAT